MNKSEENIRKCNECLESKNINDFYKKRCICKNCICQKQKEKRLKLESLPELKCSKCGIIKKSKDFHKGNPYQCKKCINLKRKINTDKQRDLYNKKHREYIKEYRKQDKIKEKRREEYRKEYYSSKNIEKRKNNKILLEKRKIENKRRSLEKRRNNIQLKIRCNISRRISSALKEFNLSKTIKTIKLLGCDFKDFLKHIEKQFYSQQINDSTIRIMSWANYGLHGWHIDHIIPCSAFNLEKIENQEKCFHYTNLRPMWAKENLSKNDKLTDNSRARDYKNFLF